MAPQYSSLLPFLATFTLGLAQLDQTGQWGDVIQFPVVPVGAYVVPEYPTSNRLLVYSSNEADSFSAGGRTLFGDYNIVTGSVSGREVAETGHNMFCPGMSSLADGTLLITGGENATVATFYEPSSNSFVTAPAMQLARGYQTSVTLSDGRVFTIGGSYTPIDRGEDKMGEVFDPATGEWTLLPGVSSQVILTNDREGIFRSDNHPWLFSWRDGSVFHAGPSTAMHWFDTTSSEGSIVEAGTRPGQDAMSGIHVMFDVGQIFSTGGSENYGNSPGHSAAHLISITDPGSPPSVETLPNMSQPRVFAGGTVLPDGTVLITGGQQYARLFNDAEAVLSAELFDPASRSFTVLASEAEARTYHSVAVLLADGTVFSGGGGLCGTCSVNHFTGQVFSPPYLFSGDELAARPVIADLSSETVSPGSQLTVTMESGDGAPAAGSFALVRIGSATHAVNSDQRRIPLEVAGEDGGEITLNIPSDSGVVIPGPYFLFAMSEDGVPSISRTVSVQI